MDAIQMIRDDHRKVETLFRDFEEASDAQTRKAIFDTIYVELDIHATLEEEIFYPSVQRQGERETVRHAEEEHGLVKELLDEMVKLDPKDPTFEAKFHVLKDNVKDHVAEEEAEMLPKAAEVGMSRLLQLGERMEHRKEQLLTSTNGRGQSTTRRKSTTATRRRTTKGRSTTARKSTSGAKTSAPARKTTTRAKASTKAAPTKKTTASRSRSTASGSRTTTSRSRATTSGARTTTSRSRGSAGGSRSTAGARTTARAGTTRTKPAPRRSGSRSSR
jgi:hemerythrin superfamily protein